MRRILGEGAGKSAAEPGKVVDHRVELAVVEYEEVAVTVGDRGRGTRTAIDQGDLAEEVARPETSDSLIVALDDDMARGDDEELMTGLALTHQHVTVGCLNLAGQRGKSLDLR